MLDTRLWCWPNVKTSSGLVSAEYVEACYAQQKAIRLIHQNVLGMSKVRGPFNYTD